MDDRDFQRLRHQVHAITRPEDGLLWYYVLTSMVALFAFPLVLVPLYFRFHTLWYRFTDEGVSMGYGILFRREMQLTYDRMQDIHLSQNILERWLGIGTLTIQTAGSSSASNMHIWGVKRYEWIRDYLYARMRGVREEPAAPAAEGDVLTEIRDALRDAARALSPAKEG